MEFEQPLSPPAPPALLEGRLHPLTLVLGLIRSVRGLIIPAIPILLVGDSFRWGRFGLLGLLLFGTVVTLLIRYFSFRYRIQAREFVTTEGLIGRKERHIPLDQIHEIRIEQNLLHRLFDVVEAVVETAGADGAEAKLSVLSRAEAERLRAAVAARSAARKTTVSATATAAQSSAREVIRQLSIQDLALHGLTSNHLLSALAILGAVWAFADDVLPDSIYERFGKFLKVAAGEMFRQGVRGALLLLAVTLASAMIVGLVFSVIGSIVRFFNYTLTRQGDELYRSYGLLTRHASSLPRHRIQVLKIEEGMLRRWFGLATLRADISGSKKEDEDDNKGRDVLLPIAWRHELDSLLAVFFPRLSNDGGEWKKVSPLAIRRGTRVGVILLALITTLVCATTKSWLGLWLLLLVPVIYWLNVKSYHIFGYALGTQYFRTRQGLLGRATHIVPMEKSQVIVVRQSPFDRRLNLATLSVDTAGQSYTGGSPSISNLPLEEALAVARTLAQKASRAGAKF
ncbi:MAG TPA: PH domain-containing protein [Blastocatellia bacterium]|nr:PH domain-containing protein [Blastocatellia bacterium]